MAEGKTRILLADDHWIILEGIKSKLAAHPEFEVCGVATDGQQAIELAGSLFPDIVVMDISMPKMNGIKAAQEIKRNCGETRIVIFSMHSAPEYILTLFRAGVSGYVLKDGPTADLLAALRTVSSGGRYFCKAIREMVKGEPSA